MCCTEQYNCVLGLLSLLTLILIATNTLSKTILKQTGAHKKDRTLQNNTLTIEKYVRYLLKIQSLYFTQQIRFIQYLSWFYCISKLKYKRGNYRCCVVLLLLLLAVLLSVYVLLLHTRKISPWIIENPCACYTCVNCCIVCNVSIAWENGELMSKTYTGIYFNESVTWKNTDHYQSRARRKERKFHVQIWDS